MKKIILIIVAIGILGAIGAYLYVYKFAAGHEDPSKSKDKVYINAPELYKYFSEHEDSANALYLSKVISVTGQITSLEMNENRYTIYLDSKDSSGAISCEMDTTENATVRHMTEGTNVNIVGFCNGINIDVSLDRCKLEGVILKN